MTHATHRIICLISLLLVGATSFRPANALQAGDPYADRVVSFQPGNPASERFRDADAVPAGLQGIDGAKRLGGIRYYDGAGNRPGSIKYREKCDW